MSALAVLLVVSAVILAAATLHRVAGLGFALVASPALIAVLGAADGIVLVAIAGMASALATLAFTFQDFVLRQVWPILAVSVAASIPTVILAQALAPGLGEILAGACALGAVGLAVSPMLWTRALSTNTFAAGVSTGALVGLAGLGGPPSASYAVARRWGESAIPNLQLIFLLGSIVNIVFRSQATTLDFSVLLAALLAVAGGTLCGHLLRERIPASRGTQAMLVVAIGGAFAALVRGVFELL